MPLLKWKHGGLTASVCFVCAGQSVDHHFLSSYYDAMLSIILAQFRSKGFADGMDGIIRLAESSDFIAVSSSTLCPQAYGHSRLLSLGP